MDKLTKYYFSEAVAKDVGVDEAIMLSNINFWVKQNAKNKNNEKDGRYWTYNSARDFAIQFKFWSEGQVRRILNNLRTNNYIDTGRFNKKGYDKTKWYTTTEKAVLILKDGEAPVETDQPCEENG